MFIFIISETAKKATDIAWQLQERVKKVSQHLPPMAANKVKKVFCRDRCLAENTSQAASVEFAPIGGEMMRAADCKTCRKAPKGVFDSLTDIAWQLQQSPGLHRNAAPAGEKD